MLWYWASVTLHVLAALLWLGGMLFLGVVGAPVLRTVQPDALRQQLFHQIGTRFRTIGWGSIAVLIVTGTLNLHYRGLLHWQGVLGSPEFWRSPLGVALGAKLAAVVMMIAVAAIHDFVLGPAAGRTAAGSAESIALRKRAAVLARVNALIGVLLVVAAVRLSRG